MKKKETTLERLEGVFNSMVLKDENWSTLHQGGWGCCFPTLSG
jgi:hypothetical protein